MGLKLEFLLSFSIKNQSQRGGVKSRAYTNRSKISYVSLAMRILLKSGTRKPKVVTERNSFKFLLTMPFPLLKFVIHVPRTQRKDNENHQNGQNDSNPHIIDEAIVFMRQHSMLEIRIFLSKCDAF